MRLRPRRRNLVVWSSTAAPVGRSRGGLRRSGARPARLSRIRWWFRTGALLTILGALRLARTARVRWEPMCLLAGFLIAVTGFELPSGGIFMLGVLVLIVTLLKGLSVQQRRRNPARSTPTARREPCPDIPALPARCRDS
jgi:hypothetical protein